MERVIVFQKPLQNCFLNIQEKLFDPSWLAVVMSRIIHEPRKT